MLRTGQRRNANALVVLPARRRQRYDYVSTATLYSYLVGIPYRYLRHMYPLLEGQRARPDRISKGDDCSAEGIEPSG